MISNFMLGDKPAFDEPLVVGKPNLGDRRKLFDALEDILDRRWLSNSGVYVKTFERQLSELLGVKHCIAVCNATIGLEVAIKSLGLQGEVIVPSFTFVATAHALHWLGITPVFCDVDPSTHNLNPLEVQKLITPRTTGILGVHLWGRPCETDALAKIAAYNNIALLYDAAHAFGCSHGEQMVGSFGAAEVFSFHATKFINTFEGGCIATNDDELASRIRLMCNFGFSGVDQVESLGTNAKMSEVSAAMGLCSLEHLNHFVQSNYRNYLAYKAELNDVPGLTLIDYRESDRPNYQYIVVEVDSEKCGISRNALLEILARENIIARRYFYPGCHRMQPYASSKNRSNFLGKLLETEKLAEKVLVLPTGTAVSESDIQLVCKIIRTAISVS